MIPSRNSEYEIISIIVVISGLRVWTTIFSVAYGLPFFPSEAHKMCATLTTKKKKREFEIFTSSVSIFLDNYSAISVINCKLTTHLKTFTEIIYCEICRHTCRRESARVAVLAC